MGNLSVVNNVDRVERFHSLQSGQYWSAKEAIPEESILAGETLLITSLRYVESQLHTVVLRTHPRLFGQPVRLVSTTERGGTISRDVTLTEHRFLFNEFLSKFEYQPDHTAIREQELQAIQAKVNEQQTQLSALMSSPEKLHRIALEMAEEERVRAEKKSQNGAVVNSANLPVTNHDAAQLAVASLQDVFHYGITEDTIAQMRSAAEHESRVASMKTKLITQKSAEIALTLGKMSPFYQEMVAARLAQTEDVRSHVDKIMAGIGNLDLFVGKDVHVIEIRKGEQAPVDMPLTVVQRKLTVDTELAVWLDVNAWFDFSSMEMFHQALRDHPGLVEQIFPTERCILAMATTHRHIDYKDAWNNQERNEKNQHVFLMVRNGENLTQIYSPVESHLGASRLFPSADEQQRHFRGRDGTTIKFEDVAYSDRLAAHEKMALHYLRFLILVCGLDYRLKLFGSFFPANHAEKFLSMEFQEKYLRFLHDEDGSGLLAEPDPRPTLSEYIKKMNAYLSSGSRVLCNWNEVMNLVTAPGVCKEDRGYSGFYRNASPKDSFNVVVATRQGADIIVEVPVTRYSTDTVFNCKVNLSKFRYNRSEDCQLAFLCLDAVKPEDLEWYIQRRVYRDDHLFYIRFFKLALKFIKSEQEEERPYRQYLLSSLVDGKVGDAENHSSLIDQCVIAWRTANRGQPLSVAMQNAKGQQALLNQLYQLAGAGESNADRVVNFVHGLGYRPLRLCVNASGKLVIYAAPTEKECDDRLEPHAWVHRITLANGKRNIREISRTWASLPVASASENMLSEWDEAKLWYSRTSAFTSWQDKQKWFDLCEKGAEQIKMIGNVTDKQVYEQLLSDWAEAYDAQNRNNTGTVNTPDLLIPVALMKNKTTASTIYLGMSSPEGWLYQNAPDDEIRDVFVQMYTGWFANAKGGLKKLLGRVEREVKFYFYSVEGKVELTGAFTRNYTFNRVMHASKLPSSPAMQNDVWLNHLALLEDQQMMYLTSSLKNEHGQPCIDELLNMKEPDNYSPIDVVEFYRDHWNGFTTDNTGKTVQIYHWYDVTQGQADEKDLLGPLSADNYRIRRFRFANQAQFIEFMENQRIRYTLSSQNGDWHQPPDGVTRYITNCR